jgi:hypothetical protein
MKYSLPGAAKPRQKTLAALLAAGASAGEAAKAVGVSVSYVNVLLKGELFNYEVDEQRRQLIGERLSEYSKRVSEQLNNNLDALVAMRDDPLSKPADRLRAIELINQSVVPRAARKTTSPEMKVAVHLTSEQKTAIKTATIEAEE